MKWIKKIHSFFTKEKNREQVIILDASALKTQKAMEFIEKAPKVIMIVGTIREIDKHKKDKTLYGKNIRTIFKASREDVEGQKYLCVSDYKKYSYEDDNIIEYCRHHKNTTILTCDNGLCSKAKAFNIPYIFPEDEQINTEPISSATSVAQKQEKQQSHSYSENQSQKEVKKEYKTNSEEVFINSKGIYITPIKGCYINYVVTRENSIVNTSDYKVGDNIYVLRYHNAKKWMEVIIYDIVDKSVKLKAEMIKKHEIWCLNDIYRLRFSQDLEDKMRNFFMKGFS